MTSITSIQETPGLKAESIVLTSGSTIEIDASADKVFQIICRGHEYNKWNTWTPNLEFEGEEGIKEGSKGTLTCWMEAQKKEYKFPITITAYSNATTKKVLAWRAALMPSWFATAERVQVVTPIGDEMSCEVRQWDSTAGWGAYILKWFMGIEAQLKETNLTYVKDLKSWAERVDDDQMTA